ncbi:MAG: sensor histidine kinase [Sphingobacteriales bacterium]|nr:sensor histidine kinase [Sphingobacteriales bacterium]
MRLFTSIRNSSYIVNLLLFLGLILFLLQPLSWHLQLPTEFWIRQVGLLFLWIGLFYLVSKVLVPFLLFKNREPAFFVFFIGSLLLTVIFSKVLEISINYYDAMTAAIKPIFKHFPKQSIFSIDAFMVFTTVLIGGISACIEIVKKWYTDNASRLQLEQEKTASELAFLKAQINPHFFFNTLNNIYSLNRINAEKAGDAIYTLSHMMRYVLYETHKDTTVKKEVQFIDDYIKLMQLRLTRKVQIIFNKPETNLHHNIAPMLFLPYVENAFKHGLSPTDNTTILINISSTDSSVCMEVRNTIVEHQSPIMEESNGIGLVNTKRRLDLMYPGKHELTIDTHTPENEYLVQLKLNF